MTTALKAKKRKSRIALLLMALVFISPVVISWCLFSFTNFGRGVDAAHGDLIAPPRLLGNVVLRDLSGRESEYMLHGKWSLLYLFEGDCERECMNGMYSMRQLRLATGKKAHRVQRVLVIPEVNDLSFPQHLREQFQGQLVLSADTIGSNRFLENFVLRSDDQPLSSGRLYLVDPSGNLMMSYPAGAPPAGIIKDLTRLLKYVRTG